MNGFPLSEALDPETLRKAMRQYVSTRDGAHLAELLRQLTDPKRLLFFPITNRGPLAYRKMLSLQRTPTGLVWHVYTSMGLPAQYAEHAIAWNHVSDLVTEMQAWGGGTIVIDDGTPEAMCLLMTDTGEQIVCAQAYLHEQVKAWQATLN